MKKIFFFAAAMMAALSINAETVFDWTGNVGTITATGTTSLEGTVKINSNKDEVSSIVFNNGYSIDETTQEHTNYIELTPAEGGFLTGDVIKVVFCYNNSAAKVANVGVYDLEGHEIAVSPDGANARLTNDVTSFNYELTADMEKVRLARGKTGKTATHIIKLEVVRGEEVAKKALNPQFSVLPGKYFEAFKLGLSTTEEGATIYCRVNATGDFAAYMDSIEITDFENPTVVEAYATLEGAANSDTIKGEFTLEHFVARPVFNARKTIDLAGITAEDIQILSGDNATIGTYTMDGKPCPAVNYVHTLNGEGKDSVMIISFAGRDGLTLRYKNSADKANALKVPANYVQADSKNYEMYVDGVQGGDTVVFVVTAKGSAPTFDHNYSTACYLTPYQPEDDTDPCFTDGAVYTASDARVENDYIGWTNLVYVVQEGHTKIRLKETANGFRIAKIQLGAYRGEAQQAISNVNAAAKAVKVVENGQLVIIKNGVKYNALGTAL